MELILGGAYQGKCAWAAEKFSLRPEEIRDLSQGLPQTMGRCYCHLEALTRRAAEDGVPAQTLLSRLEPYLTEDSVWIAREVGAGVVPMDAVTRQWRELHGQVTQALARRACHVTRIYCGLPEALK